MKLIVKKLQGDECILEVSPTTYISEVKKQVAQKLHIPVEQQKLLYLGRTLADNQTIEKYPIKDGTKLNLIVKKPDGLYEVSLKHFKKSGMSETEAASAAKQLLKVVQENFNKLSWDDIERLSMDCLLDERGQKRNANVDHDPECDDMYVL